MDILIDDLAKAERFAAIFQHLKSLTDSINISFSEERMYIQSMDSANVSIVEISIPAAWFGSYCKVGSGTTVIGVSSGILYRILSSRDKSQTIALRHTEGEDTLCAEMRSCVKSVFDKSFEVPLFDLETDFMEIPEIEYQAEMSIPSGNFAGIVNQLKMFGDTMDIECSETNIRLCAHSVDQGKMRVDISIDDISAFAIDEGEELLLSFSLRYMHIICQYCKIADVIELRMSRDFPVRIDYDLGEGARVKFFLSPKIRSDED